MRIPLGDHAISSLWFELLVSRCRFVPSAFMT